MRHVYPAIIKPDEELDECFHVRFPDLDCEIETYEIHDSNNVYCTLVDAAELLNKHMIELEDAGKEIPKPTYIKDVKIADKEIVTLIKADTEAYRLLRAKMLIP